MKKKIIIIAVAAVAALVELCILIGGATEDKKAPEIRIYQNNIKYSIGCDDEVILKGVEANDEEDGDVTDSVEIISRSTIVANRLEAVTISACDKSGNVATTKIIFAVEADNTFKILDYSKYEVDMEKLEFSVDGAEIYGSIDGFELPTTNSNEEGTTPQESTTPEESTTPQENSTPEESTTPEESSTPEESTTPEEPTTPEETSSETPQVGADGKPVIELKYNEVTVEAGASSVVYVNSINEIYDDKDTRDYLFRRVGLTKNIDLSVPGDYVQGLYVSDSDGNRSEVVQLTIHVR